MHAGGTITVGNLTWTARPDVYLAGLRKVNDLIHAGLLTGTPVAYATNDLTIMVPAGNPGHVTGLQDLGRPDIAVVMPNPQWEGVARQIRASLAKAGGEALATRVYDGKVKDGTTILTRVHHRQTPLFLMQGLGQAGVTWKSEAIFQEQVGHAIAHVSIPPGQNTTAIYAGAIVKGARHQQAAQDWLRFIASPAALRVFERYGFKPYQSGNQGSAKSGRP
jgi:ABC-type sulfate transport system substrate-binding protein